jgi:hypothetical protein
VEIRRSVAGFLAGDTIVWFWPGAIAAIVASTFLVGASATTDVLMSGFLLSFVLLLGVHIWLRRKLPIAGVVLAVLMAANAGLILFDHVPRVVVIGLFLLEGAFIAVGAWRRLDF